MTGHDGYDDISVAASGGTTPEALKAAISRELGSEFAVRTGKEQAAKQAQDLSDALGFIRTALLVFAARRAARRQLPDLQHLLRDRRAAHEGVRAAAHARRLARPGAALGARRDGGDRRARVAARDRLRPAARARPGGAAVLVRHRPGRHEHGARAADGRSPASWSGSSPPSSRASCPPAAPRGSSPSRRCATAVTPGAGRMRRRRIVVGAGRRGDRRRAAALRPARRPGRRERDRHRARRSAAC